MQEINTMGKIVQTSPQQARGASQFRASVQNVSSKSYGQSFLSQWGEVYTSSPKAARPLQCSSTNEKETMTQLEQVNDRVTKFFSFADLHLRPYLQEKVEQFSAGQIKYYFHEWQKITSDKYILQIVAGDVIGFNGPPPINNGCPDNHISNDTISSIKVEINSLLANRVFVTCTHEINEFISPIFTVPKPDNKIRLILNLKSLNSHVTYYHFKMDSIQTVTSTITENCWMASIDLKDVYYSIPIHPAYPKYLRFQFLGQLYQFIPFPNDLVSCPRKFTKLLKPPLAMLRERDHLLSSYIDDIYIQH